MSERLDTRAMRQVADLLLGRDHIPWPIFRTIATVPEEQIPIAVRFCHDRISAMRAVEKNPTTRERREVLRFMRGARQALRNRQMEAAAVAAVSIVRKD